MSKAACENGPRPATGGHKYWLMRESFQAEQFTNAAMCIKAYLVGDTTVGQGGIVGPHRKPVLTGTDLAKDVGFS